MNPNSHISYLIEVHLEVSATNESAQESSFSAEYTLTPVENSTYSAEIREGQALFEISMDSICMNLDKSVTKSVDFLRRGRVKYQVRIYVIFLLKTNSGVLNINFSLGL